MNKVIFAMIFIFAFIIKCEMGLKDSTNPLDPKNIEEEDPLSIICLNELIDSKYVRNVYWENSFIHKRISQISINGIIENIDKGKLKLPQSSGLPLSYETVPASYVWPIPNIQLYLDKSFSNHYLRIRRQTNSSSIFDIILAEDTNGLNMLSLNDHINSNVDLSNKYQGDYNIQVNQTDAFKNFTYIKFIWASKKETEFYPFSVLQE